MALLTSLVGRSIIRRQSLSLDKMVSPTSTSTNERGSLPGLLRGQHVAEGTMVLRRLFRQNNKHLSVLTSVPRTQLKQKQGLGNRKALEVRGANYQSLIIYREGSRVLGS